MIMVFKNSTKELIPMPAAVVDERQALRQIIDLMSADDVLKMLDYAAYLRYLEEREDEEDAAYITAHKDDPVIPLEDALKELGL